MVFVFLFHQFHWALDQWSSLHLSCCKLIFYFFFNRIILPAGLRIDRSWEMREWKKQGGCYSSNKGCCWGDSMVVMKWIWQEVGFWMNSEGRDKDWLTSYTWNMRKKGVGDDSKVYGLSNWKDGVVTNWETCLGWGGQLITSLVLDVLNLSHPFEHPFGDIK